MYWWNENNNIPIEYWAQVGCKCFWLFYILFFFSLCSVHSLNALSKHHQLSGRVSIATTMSRRKKNMIEFQVVYIGQPHCFQMLSLSLFLLRVEWVYIFQYVVVCNRRSICQFDRIKWSNIEFDWISKAHKVTSLQPKQQQQQQQ